MNLTVVTKENSIMASLWIMIRFLFPPPIHKLSRLPSRLRTTLAHTHVLRPRLNPVN
jgi:hypothetical protein